MALTTFTDARLMQQIATLYKGESVVSQLVAPGNKIVVDRVSRAATIVKDFIKMVDGTTTALTRATSEPTPAASDSIYPVTFTMFEYGKDEDALEFPWQEFMVRADSPGIYEAIVELMANKALTAIDTIGTAFIRDTIGAGTAAAYTHPLGPDDLGAGVMGFTSPVTSKLVRYGTQATSRAARADITTADTASWDMVRSMRSTLRDRHVRPVMYDRMGGPVYALIAHDHLIVDLYKSLNMDAFPAVNQWISDDQLASRGLGAGIWGMFEGVILIASTRMKYAGGGAGAIDVYPMTMVGGDFLAKAALSPSAMPSKPADGELYNIGDGACVIVQPKYADVHSNRLGTCAWYGYLGWGIYDPYSYCRVECASTSAGRY